MGKGFGKVAPLFNPRVNPKETYPLKTRIEWKGYQGEVVGYWSNFGILVLFDGDNESKIMNCQHDKITTI